MGGSSFSSDQSVAHATATAQMVATGGRVRLTSIKEKVIVQVAQLYLEVVVLQEILLQLIYLEKKV